jgi:hypothetical protein
VKVPLFSIMSEQNTYFARLDDFLKSLLERTSKVYSVIEIMDHIPINPELLLTKRFTSEYLNSKSYGGGLLHLDGIFRNQAGIYLYLSKTEVESTYKIKVIYDVAQLDEVVLFIKNLNRLK